jgi:hypothetical protein
VGASFAGRDVGAHSVGELGCRDGSVLASLAVGDGVAHPVGGVGGRLNLELVVLAGVVGGALPVRCGGGGDRLMAVATIASRDLAADTAEGRGLLGSLEGVARALLAGATSSASHAYTLVAGGARGELLTDAVGVASGLDGFKLGGSSTLTKLGALAVGAAGLGLGLPLVGLTAGGGGADAIGESSGLRDLVLKLGARSALLTDTVVGRRGCEDLVLVLGTRGSDLAFGVEAAVEYLKAVAGTLLTTAATGAMHGSTFAAGGAGEYRSAGTVGGGGGGRGLVFRGSALGELITDAVRGDGGCHLLVLLVLDAFGGLVALGCVRGNNGHVSLSIDHDERFRLEGASIASDTVSAGELIEVRTDMALHAREMGGTLPVVLAGGDLLDPVIGGASPMSGATTVSSARRHGDLILGLATHGDGLTETIGPGASNTGLKLEFVVTDGVLLALASEVAEVVLVRVGCACDAAAARELGVTCAEETGLAGLDVHADAVGVLGGSLLLVLACCTLGKCGALTVGGGGRSHVLILRVGADGECEALAVRLRGRSSGLEFVGLALLVPLAGAAVDAGGRLEGVGGAASALAFRDGVVPGAHESMDARFDTVAETIGGGSRHHNGELAGVAYRELGALAIRDGGSRARLVLVAGAHTELGADGISDIGGGPSLVLVLRALGGRLALCGVVSNRGLEVAGGAGGALASGGAVSASVVANELVALSTFLEGGAHTVGRHGRSGRLVLAGAVTRLVACVGDAGGESFALPVRALGGSLGLEVTNRALGVGTADAVRGRGGRCRLVFSGATPAEALAHAVGVGRGLLGGVLVGGAVGPEHAAGVELAVLAFEHRARTLGAHTSVGGTVTLEEETSSAGLVADAGTV